MNVSIGKNLEKYIQWQLKNGPFNNASEIVRDALRLHKENYAEKQLLIGDDEEVSKWKEEMISETNQVKADKSA